MMDTEPAVQVRGLNKHFGATRALTDIDLDVAAGTVHALVGENGAGKSTCLGLIGGRISPTSGSIEVLGNPLHHGDPRAARRAGVAVIYQELTISPHLSTQANVFLGNEIRSRGLLNEADMRSAFLDLCRQMDLHLPSDVPAGTLSVADQQMLEIQRALVADPRVILFDEPTAALAEHERETLFAVMRSLRDRGVTLMLVSHNLDEVLAISDVVTVFRNGRLVRTAPTREWTKSTLVRAMLGDKVTELRSGRASTARTEAASPRVRVRNLVVPGVLGPIDFDLWPGEILGVGGVVGSGRTCLLSALAGLIPRACGELEIDGTAHPWPTTVQRSRALGFALVPEDRKKAGVFQALSGHDNVTISDYRQVSRRGVLSPARMRTLAGAAASRVALDEQRLTAPAATLSGGNQQKAILARWQHAPPRVLLADEPTRGVDIGAKAEVMTALSELAARGMALMVVSSELEEIADNADRALVLSEGRQVGELSRAAGDLDVHSMLHLAFRTESAS
jgi:ABC-type sugar transport system ATPase subunit